VGSGADPREGAREEARKAIREADQRRYLVDGGMPAQPSPAIAQCFETKGRMVCWKAPPGRVRN
jgi:hypothetical protein